MIFMAGESKFVQITATSKPASVTDRGAVQLFALDTEGDVWQYAWGEDRGQDSGWYALPVKRKK
jgi:hypothetical protein